MVIVLVFNFKSFFLNIKLIANWSAYHFYNDAPIWVDANIVALSGIAIAIGVMVDVGVVFTENIIRHIALVENIGARGKRLLNVVYEATIEVAGAVITALTTTIVSFLPVFAMEAAEGKLFKPLAFTKTFTMLAALLIGLIIIPTLAHVIFSIRFDKKKYKKILAITLIVAGLVIPILTGYYIALALSAYGINSFFEDKWKASKIVGGILLMSS